MSQMQVVKAERERAARRQLFRLVHGIERKLRRGWCRNAHARDARGRAIEAHSDPSAVAWCLMGAYEDTTVPIRHELGVAPDLVANAMDSAAQARYGMETISANDKKIKSKRDALDFMQDVRKHLGLPCRKNS